jgi:hypothetical protein
MNFDQFFKFQNIKDSYIFVFEDLSEWIQHLKISVEEFAEIVKQLHLVDNLSAKKNAYRDGEITLKSGVKLPFDPKTKSVDGLDVLEVKEDGSNTMITINGFPLSDKQGEDVETLAQQFNIKRWVKLPYDVFLELLLEKNQIQGKALIGLCSSDAVISAKCNHRNQLLFRRALLREFGLESEHPREDYVKFSKLKERKNQMVESIKKKLEQTHTTLDILGYGYIYNDSSLYDLFFSANERSFGLMKEVDRRDKLQRGLDSAIISAMSGDYKYDIGSLQPFENIKDQVVKNHLSDGKLVFVEDIRGFSSWYETRKEKDLSDEKVVREVTLEDFERVWNQSVAYIEDQIQKAKVSFALEAIAPDGLRKEQNTTDNVRLDYQTRREEIAEYITEDPLVILIRNLEVRLESPKQAFKLRGAKVIELTIKDVDDFWDNYRSYLRDKQLTYEQIKTTLQQNYVGIFDDMARDAFVDNRVDIDVIEEVLQKEHSGPGREEFIDYITDNPEILTLNEEELDFLYLLYQSIITGKNDVTTFFEPELVQL